MKPRTLAEVAALHVFSAKGAALFQPGATPQETCRLPSRALKARLMAGAIRSFIGTIDRAFSPNFCGFSFSWGVAPGWYDPAPSALNRYAAFAVQGRKAFWNPSRVRNIVGSVRGCRRGAPQPPANFCQPSGLRGIGSGGVAAHQLPSLTHSGGCNPVGFEVFIRRFPRVARASPACAAERSVAAGRQPWAG